MLSRRFAAPVAALLVLAACSDAQQSTNSTAAAPTDNSPTTIDIAEQALAYSEYGDFPVGVTTLQLAKGPKVEIWYPAAAGTSGTETYDMRDFVGEGIRAILTGDAPSTYSYPAGRDALLADGSFPVVLFSHGVAGMRLQSSFLTSNLASWGMIVVSVDHPSRALENFLTGTATGDGGDSVDDMLRGLELITTLGADATSRFNGHVDAEKVAAVGHSAGGGTVLAAAADRRIDGYVSLASGVFRGGPAVEGATTTTTAPLPGKPSFFIGGSVDALASFATLTQPAFEAAPSPSLLWEIEGAGHNAFDDFCTFGNGTGIIGVAEASGLGALLDSIPQLRSLGEDGCVPPAIPVDITFPIINHAVTAWVRNLFGIDTEAVGLGDDVAGAYDTPVTITSK
ncbi:MAG: alpha/beta hydrolase [Acidimicrobiaceae bacterium]|nr:alpha/beta hydrolase [Acidimicrobiaceae bacterium]